MSLDGRRLLYDLLPAFYRIKDEQQGYPLQALLEVLAGQHRIVEQDIARLYENWFIETCAPWLVPYIGDLVGNRPIHPIRHTTRADVAKTIYYRRRKGTLAMLEELARDVTGWGAHAVEFFELLDWTQNVNHVRVAPSPSEGGIQGSGPATLDPQAVSRVGTVNLRDMDSLDRLNGPFDTVAHGVDVRPVAQEHGWYNIKNVGFFLWRLQAFPLEKVKPRLSASQSYGFRFSPLGQDVPLFTDSEAETDPSGLAGEIHVPGPIRSRAFYNDLERYRTDNTGLSPDKRAANSDYYGPEASLVIIKDGQAVPPMDIRCMDLEKWPEPPTGTVGVDVRRGRLAVPKEEAKADWEVSFSYGFSGDLGGGPYDRRQPRLQPNQLASVDSDSVADPEALDVLIRLPSNGINTLSDALASWNPVASPRAVIQIDDSRTYPEDLTINLARNELVIQAANRHRPILRGSMIVIGGTGKERLVLNGLLIEGNLQVQGSLGELKIMHCTLVPGRSLDEAGQPLEPDRPSVIVKAPNDRLGLRIDHSIVGSLCLPAEMASLRIEDSIIDSPATGVSGKLVPALVSGNLLPFSAPSSSAPKVRVTIGNEGPHVAVFAGVPTTMAQARDRLQEAIRAAYTGPAFARARVITIANRLIVLPGVAGAVTIEAVGADPTATELRLDRPAAYRVYALVGGSLSPFPSLTSSSPRMYVTMGAEGPYEVVLTSVPDTISKARDQLQAAIRNAHASQAFTGALVGSADEQLVVLPGTEGTAAFFRAVPADQTTLRELALDSERPAVAGSDASEWPGPPTWLERATVFGAVHVKELTLASEVIFTAPVVVERHQVGCVRFSYFPQGSRPPKGYRCQPDLALADAARVKESVLTAAETNLVRSRVEPAFTSIHYGDPGYGQLRFDVAQEIYTGGEGGAEMGAFNSLQQPQREANLRTRLKEYLPLGLEAGLIFVT